jgi:hypothetical protein
MAGDLLGQFQATDDKTFQQRVSAAIAVVALQVYTESPQPTNHAARAAYAVQVILNPPLSMVSLNSFGTSQPDKTVYGITRLLASEGLDNSATDAQIETAISNAWNALAGA